MKIWLLWAFLIPNYRIFLPRRRSTTVSLETRNPINLPYCFETSREGMVRVLHATQNLSRNKKKNVFLVLEETVVLQRSSQSKSSQGKFYCDISLAFVKRDHQLVYKHSIRPFRIINPASSIVSALMDSSFYEATLSCELFPASSPIATVDGAAFPACVRV